MNWILWLWPGLSPTSARQLVTYGHRSLPFNCQCLKSAIKHQTIYHLKGRKTHHTMLELVEEMYGEAIQILQANGSGGKEGWIDNLWGSSDCWFGKFTPGLTVSIGRTCFTPSSSENWTRISYHEKTKISPDFSLKAWPNTRPDFPKLHRSVNLRTKMKLSEITSSKRWPTIANGLKPFALTGH